jgi:hypothetical protein
MYLPKLNKVVLDKIDSFRLNLPEDYFFLHIRTSDIIDGNTERYDKIINNVKTLHRRNKLYFSFRDK